MNDPTQQTYEIRPIGVVRWDHANGAQHECVIEMRSELQPAMLGVEPGDRVQVLYWMNRLSEGDRRILQCHPRGDSSKPMRGVFALRSPMRPNPIGSTVVRVKEVHGNKLVVSGLDALDGSPVVDIKIAMPEE